MFRVMLAGVMGGLMMAGAAAAEPFESFVTLCVENNGDRPAAHAAAKRARWTELTAEMMDPGEADFREQVLHVNMDPSDRRHRPRNPEMLLTGWGDGEEMLGAESVVLEICGVMAPGVDVPRVRTRISRLIGDPAPTGEDGQPMWLYSRNGDRFLSEAALADADDGAIEAAARNRDLYVVFALDQDGMAVLMLGAVRSVLRLRAER